MHGLKYYLTRALLIVFMLLESSQSWSQGHDNWTVGFQGGITSYYGDLSRHDTDPLKKISVESDRYFGLAAGKKISPTFNIVLSFSDHKLTGKNSYESFSFSSSFKEILLGVDVSVMSILLSQTDSRFDLYGKAGGGIFIFDSFKVISDNANPDNEDPEPDIDKTGTVITGGFGTSYHVNSRWKVSLEFVGRIASSDLLDGFEGTSGIDDFYSTLGIGVTYTLNFKDGRKGFYQEGSREYRRYKRNDNAKRYNFITQD